jgi:hypothetical protein
VRVSFTTTRGANTTCAVERRTETDRSINRTAHAVGSPGKWVLTDQQRLCSLRHISAHGCCRIEPPSTSVLPRC